MDHVLVYGDSLTWGIVPGTRRRLPIAQRWPYLLEGDLARRGHAARVIEDCLNGRRTVWEDPFKPGRNGLTGLEQRIEVNSPLALVMLMLGTNDFQAVHQHNAWQSSQGVAALVRAVRGAPIEPGMPTPGILIVAPPPLRTAAGEMTEKFDGADRRCVGVADAFRAAAVELDCAFFDAGTVVQVSAVDGVHLDADQHCQLAAALAPVVANLLS
jgi:lysophospholipase L1-like esterase